jgi:hypothetical protein|tara:strand:- start:319 stop:1098 length:780 start_codon:yes stop_codon:yes gene_type:complete
MPYIGKTPTAAPLSASDLDDDIISLAKMASGTDGNIITYDTSGNPVAVATGNDGQVLTSAGAGQPCAFEAAGGGDVVKLVAANADGSANAISIDGYFSSTYQRYVLHGRNLVGGSATATDVQMRVNVGGSANTDSNYVQTNWQEYTDTTPSHAIAVATAGNGSLDMDAPDSLWEINADNFADDATTGGDLEVEIFDPLSTARWKQMRYSLTYVRQGENTFQTVRGSCLWQATTALTGLTILLRASVNISGDFYLYGYKA